MNAAVRMASARRAARELLDRASAHLLAAEIHMTVTGTRTYTATVSDAHLVEVSGATAHACVRAWTPGGVALVCVEDATEPALAWALDLAARTAPSNGGLTDFPVPATNLADAPEPPGGILVEHDPRSLVLVLVRAVRTESLPARDIRLVVNHEQIATLSTNGVAAAEERVGCTAGAFVSFHHPLEPADALVSAYDPLDAAAAGEALLAELRILRAVAEETTGDPVTTVPTGMPTLCRPRATARLLALVAAREFGGHRAASARAPAANWSDRLHVVENPHDEHNPRRRLFDDEGLPTRRLSLVTGGGQRAHLHTTATAAAVGVAPNGCATRGPSHVPVPGFRGLDLRPTVTGPLDVDEVFLIEDLIVAQESVRATGALVVLGRLRAGGAVRPVRMAVGRHLLDDFTEHAQEVVADGRWDLDGVHSRTVLLDRSRR